MPRSYLDPTMAAALDDPVIRIVLFVEAHFVSGVRRLCTMTSDFEWNGYTWVGSKNQAGAGVVSIGRVEETQQIKAGSIKVTIDGTNPAYISDAMQEMRRGKAGKMWLGLLSASRTLIGSPGLMFDARLDTCNLDENSITLGYVDRIVDLENPRGGRYTDADQRIRYPNDRGFSHVTALVDRQFEWGKPK